MLACVDKALVRSLGRLLPLLADSSSEEEESNVCIQAGMLSSSALAFLDLVLPFKVVLVLAFLDDEREEGEGGVAKAGM
jgi:hypothetical protein